MKTEVREVKVKVADSINDAIDWLKAEYPHGVDLVYIDYRDHYEDADRLLQVITQGYEEDDFWINDNQYDSIGEIVKKYQDKLGADEISEEVNEAMRDWLLDHDTSTPYEDLLKNTGRALFYIELDEYAEVSLSGVDKPAPIIRKYGKTEDEKKEIKTVLENQFYTAPISFYFYASVASVYDAIKNSAKYVAINGAYFSTIDRERGSNWLGNNGIFKIVVPTSSFTENIRLDKGDGYGWDEIAGQCDYDEAKVKASDTKPKGFQKIEGHESEEMKRERKLEKNWRKTKKCQMGDMKMTRHNNVEYINDFPCGHKCKDCGTFWID